MRAYVIILTIGILIGWTINGWRLDARATKNEIDFVRYARSIELLANENSNFIANEFELKRQIDASRNKVIEKEVIKYVQNPDSGNCKLSDDFVRIDTEAATGLPENVAAATSIDDSTSKFTDIDLIQVITDRSEICRNEINKLAGLQEWANGQLLILNN